MDFKPISTEPVDEREAGVFTPASTEPVDNEAYINKLVEDDTVDPVELYRLPQTKELAAEVAKRKAKKPTTISDVASDAVDLGKGFLRGAVEIIPTMIRGATALPSNIYDIAKHDVPNYQITSEEGLGGGEPSQHPEAQRARREIASSMELGVTGAGNMGRIAGRNISRAAAAMTGGVVGTGNDELTPQQWEERLAADASWRERMEKLQAGEPQVIPVPSKSTPEELKTAGAPIRPENIEGMSEIFDPTNVPIISAAKGTKLAGKAALPQRLVNKIGGTSLQVLGKTLKTGGRVADNKFIRGGRNATIAGSVMTGNLPTAAAITGATIAGKGARVVGERLDRIGREMKDGAAPNITQRSNLSRIFDRGVQGATAGGVVGTGFAIGSESPEQAGEQIGSGVALGGATATTTETGMAGRRKLFDPLFTTPSNPSQATTPSPDPFDYGVEEELDKAHNEAMSRATPESRDEMNRLRRLVQGRREIYELPEAEFNKVAEATGKNAQGIIHENHNGRPVIFVKEGARARWHEVGHDFYGMLDPETKTAIDEAMLARNDPDAFASRYESALQGEKVDVKYSELTPEAQAKVKEEMSAEMMQAVANGLPIDQLTSDPGLIRRIRTGLGRAAESLGLPTTTEDVQTALGVQPTFRAALILEKALRDQAASSAKVPPLIPNESTETPEAPAETSATATESPRPDAPVDPMVEKLLPFGATQETAKSALAEARKAAHEADITDESEIQFYARSIIATGDGRWRNPPPPKTPPKSIDAKLGDVTIDNPNFMPSSDRYKGYKIYFPRSGSNSGLKSVKARNDDTGDVIEIVLPDSGMSRPVAIKKMREQIDGVTSFMPATRGNTIDRPASKINDLIFPGTRPQAIRAAKKFGLSDLKIEEGFVTEGGKWMNPEEARALGEDTGQLPEGAKGGLTPQDLASQRRFMPSSHPEAIDKPAIKRKSDGKIFTASKRDVPHWMMPQEHPELQDRFTLGGVDRYVDGWTDNSGNFLDKKQGHARALKTKQIDKNFKTEYRGALSTMDMREGARFMPSNHPDAVDKAALKMPDGRIFKGTHHAEAMDQASKFYLKQGEKAFEQFDKWVDSYTEATEKSAIKDGFVDKKGGYLTRKEAETRAAEVGQLQYDSQDGLEAFDFNATRRFMPSVNIGLDVKGGERMAPDRVLAELGKYVKVNKHSVHQSDSEPTLVANLDRPLTPEEASKVSAALDQEAIAQHDGTTGELYGPKADNWKPFNPEFFLNQDGKRLSEVPNGPQNAPESPVARPNLSEVSIEPTPRLNENKRVFEGKTIEMGEEPWSIRLKELGDKEWNGKKLTEAEEREFADLHEKAKKEFGSYANWFEKMGGEKDYLGKVFGEEPMKDVKFMPSAPIEREATRLGLQYKGDMGEGPSLIHLYNDPITKTTIAVKANVERGELQRKLKEKRDLYRGALGDVSFMPAVSDLGFYSKLEDVLESKMGGKATAEQIRGLVKSGGVKTEELKWTGLDDFLAEQEKLGLPVTKKEILDHVRANNVEVTEVIKGRPPANIKINRASKYAIPEVLKIGMQHQGSASDALRLTLENDGDAYRAISKKFPELERNGVDWADEVVRDVFADSQNAVDTKFSQHVLPGGEEGSYRELLLTRPRQSEYASLPKGFRLVAGQSADGSLHYKVLDNEGYQAGIGNTKKEATNLALENLNRAEGWRGVYRSDEFESSHWDEPNVLAHVRFDTRTSPDGKKTLHIAEIQSDMHQKGRKEGYNTITPAEKIELEGLVRDKPRSEFENNPRWKELRDKNDSTVPDAPFKTSWPALAMKRMIRYAAENGFSRISWDTGATQAERYDLSKFIDNLEVYKTGENIYSVRSFPTQDATVADIVKGYLAESQLADTIGKDLAEKAIKDLANKSPSENEPMIYSGLDLKVGGEGMKGFYDKILPSVANDLGKKFGARVTSTGMNVPAKYGIEEYGGSYYIVDQAELGDRMFDPEDDLHIWETNSAKAAESHARRLSAKEPSPSVAHSLDITPQMRESVMIKGQPLFMPSTDSWGSIHKHLTPEEFSSIRERDTQKVIDVFNKLPSVKHGVDTALKGKEQRNWYRDSAQAISNTFGPDADRFAALLAALSPQVSVETNLTNAVAVWNNWLKAGRPTDRATIENIMGESVIGDRGEKSVLNAWRNNSIRSLTLEDPNEIKLSGPKVDSFMRNLRNNVMEITNDRWMGVYGGLPEIHGRTFGKKHKQGTEIKGLPYLAMNAHIRKVAKALTKQTGENWTPSETQAAIWSYIKSKQEGTEIADVPVFDKLLRKAGALGDVKVGDNPF